jgi:biotin operon repressor
MVDSQTKIAKNLGVSRAAVSKVFREMVQIPGMPKPIVSVR